MASDKHDAVNTKPICMVGENQIKLENCTTPFEQEKKKNVKHTNKIK